MAIDVRASISCSLGDIISGGISDDYFGEEGLIRTRGRVEVLGILKPSIGSTVTFSYDAFGTERRIPRRLYVLSSFADPFRRTTQVELGCRLTYLQDRRPAPTVQGAAAEPSIITGKTIQCLNNYSPPPGETFSYPANSQVGFPIRAKDVMKICLDKLGITASQNPLTNVLYVEKFDLTPGYVQVLSGLLISEGYCGYLDENDKLQVFSLKDEGGSAPVVSQEQVIDISSAGLGELPADAIVVRYNSVKLSGDAALDDPETTPEGEVTVQRLRDWTLDEETGEQIEFQVRATSGVYTYYHIPYTKTETTYGQDKSWDDDSCVIYGKEGADLSDAVIKRVTSTNVIAADVANSYVAQIIDLGAVGAGALAGVTKTVATYEYDNKGNQTKEIVENYEPFFMWAGRMNMTWVYGDGYIQLGTGDVLVSRQITTTTTLYAPLTSATVGPDEVVEPLVNGQKVVRTVYQNWALTQQGNQGVAGNREVFDFTSAYDAVDYLSKISAIMVPVDTTINSSNGRIISGYSKRPKYATQLNSTTDADAQSGPDTVQTDELLYVTGSASSNRIVELSMPYQSDDYYTATGVLVKGDAAAKAANYGRIQNKLRYGQRYGLNIQTAAAVLPPKPFQPFALNAAGFAGLYRTNGLSWTFDGNGILMSCDALLWGGLGSTTGSSAPAADAFFPVAPGVTTVPTAPAVVDTAPDQLLEPIATVGTTPQTTLDAAYPDAVAGDGVQALDTDEFWVYDGTTWESVGTNPGPTMEVVSPLPVWQEIRPMLATVRTGIAVTSFNYALEQLTVVAALTVRSKLTAASILKVEVPATEVTMAAVAPVVSIGAAVRPAATAIVIGAEVPSVAAGASVQPPAIDVALAALAPDVRTGASVSVPAVDISVAAVAPVSVGMPSTLVGVPASDIAIAAVAPVVVSGTSVAVPAKDIAVAAVVPTVLSADPNFSNVSLLLHMDGSNGSTTFTDKSLNTLPVTVTGNAQVSTAQSQFGGASLLLDGSGDYLSLADNAALELGSSNYTIEMWIRTTQSRQYATLIARGNSNFSSGSWALLINNNSATAGDVAAWSAAYSGFNPLLLTTGVNVRDGAWHHIAWVRSGTSHYLYVDGTQRASRTSTSFTVPDMTVTTYIGYDGNFTPRDFDGYIDELRISKVARYTSAFTPTTVAFPDA